METTLNPQVGPSSNIRLNGLPVYSEATGMLTQLAVMQEFSEEKPYGWKYLYLLVLQGASLTLDVLREGMEESPRCVTYQILEEERDGNLFRTYRIEVDEWDHIDHQTHLNYVHTNARRALVIRPRESGRGMPVSLTMNTVWMVDGAKPYGRVALLGAISSEAFFLVKFDESIPLEEQPQLDNGSHYGLLRGIIAENFGGYSFPDSQLMDLGDGLYMMSYYDPNVYDGVKHPMGYAIMMARRISKLAWPNKVAELKALKYANRKLSPRGSDRRARNLRKLD